MSRSTAASRRPDKNVKGSTNVNHSSLRFAWPATTPTILPHKTPAAKVGITTPQRLYSMVKGDEDSLEENEKASLFETDTPLCRESLPTRTASGQF